MWRADRKQEDGASGAGSTAEDVAAAEHAASRAPGTVSDAVTANRANDPAAHAADADAHKRALHPVKNSTAPHTVGLGTADAAPGNIAEPVWRAWREELAALGGRSPLLHFTDTARTRLELSTTHPGGLPQFITGKTTLLSSLIRDDLALRNAKLAAGAVTEKGVELRAVRGNRGRSPGDRLGAVAVCRG